MKSYHIVYYASIGSHRKGTETEKEILPNINAYRRPKEVGGRNEDEAEKGEKHIVKGCPTFIVLEIGFAHDAAAG